MVACVALLFPVDSAPARTFVQCENARREWEPNAEMPRAEWDALSIRIVSADAGTGIT